MGEKKNRRETFLLAHPVCVFCGGGAKATTIEHCPPRSMFQGRQWPEGFEFPACDSCNHGTSDQDLLVAMLARMDPFENQGNSDGRLAGIMEMVHEQFPELFAKMLPSAAEARRKNRELGLQRKVGQTHQDVGVAKIPQQLKSAVATFALKLAKAIFYLVSKQPFPNEGCLLLNWFTNADYLRDGKYVAFESLRGVAGAAPPLKRSGKFLNNQFEYKLSISTDLTTFVLQARFGRSFGVVIFGCALPGHLEAIVEKLTQETGKDGPFSILQSPTMKRIENEDYVGM